MARTKYYHADEVAELLGITIDEVRVMLKNKELKGHKLGRRWLIDMEQPCFEKLVSNDSITIKQEPIFRYIKDEEHEEMFRKYLFSVKKSLYISTGDFKTVYFDGEELASILNGMANRGIEVVVKCMNPYGHDELECDFDLVVCDKNHMKLYFFDEKTLYIGSANLTKAAIARNSSSHKACNHEAGILTTDPTLIKQVLHHFKYVASNEDCKTCKKKGCKNHHS